MSIKHKDTVVDDVDTVDAAKWNKEHTFWIVQVDACEFTYEDNRMMMHLKHDWGTPNKVFKMMGYERTSYGTFETHAKCTGMENGKIYYVSSFEEWPGWTDNCIFVVWRNTAYKLETRSGGVETATTLSGQDWTTERTFKIVWDASNVYLYVDGVEKAHHTTNVPTTKLQPFFEIAVTTTTPTYDSFMQHEMNHLVLA